MSTSRDTYAVIMAGGSGTRFWPASRRLRPKQLLPLASERSLLREAIDRVSPICGVDNIFIATGSHLADATLEAAPMLSRSQLLIEPAARNTAPCIAWAAATVARKNPEAVVIALPSDPHIEDPAGFERALERAVETARDGVITTIGIKPSSPETGYGYIETSGDPKGNHGATYDVARFVEKPDLEHAKLFIEAGNFYWNAGMFFFRACDMLEAVRTHMPELAAGLDKLDAAAAAGNEESMLTEIFPTLPAKSIDHGVMEHIDKLAMVAGDFGWSDLGSWPSVSELATKDDSDNSAPAGTIMVDAQHNHVVDMRSTLTSNSAKRVIALVGVSNLVVVETDDALLIVDKRASQQVRDVVAQLRERGDPELI